MTAKDVEDDRDGEPAVIPFPFSRVRPAATAIDDGTVIYGEMASTLGNPHEQTTGHWCSRCSKIWYGYVLEVTCPTCGNRSCAPCP